MGEKGPMRWETEKGVIEATVAKVDFWRFHLPFGNVFKPGLKLSEHECARENVGVLSHGFIGEIERATNL